MVPYELLQDLNRLVCSSKNKKIESLFIKLANESQEGFHNWVLKNGNNELIKQQMTSPVLLEAINYLFANKDLLNDEPVNLLHDDATKKYIDIYLLLSLNKRDNRLKSILAPFSPVLTWSRKTRMGDVPEEVQRNFNHDMVLLLNTYETQGEEKRRVHHERISPQEMQNNSPESDSEQKRRLRTYRYAFGYLAKNWTALIKSHIQRQNKPEYWAKTMDVLNNNGLHRTGDVLSALPYFPDMRDSGADGAKIFRKIPPYFQQYGDVAAYNLINRDIFGALKMPMAQQTASPQDNTDYSSFYESGGDPSPGEPIVRDESNRSGEGEHLNEMASEDVLECSFIFFATTILAQIEELIKQY